MALGHSTEGSNGTSGDHREGHQSPPGQDHPGGHGGNSTEPLRALPTPVSLTAMQMHDETNPS